MDTEAQNGKSHDMHRRSSALAPHNDEPHNNDLSHFLCKGVAPSSYMYALRNHMSNR